MKMEKILPRLLKTLFLLNKVEGVIFVYNFSEWPFIFYPTLYEVMHNFAYTAKLCPMIIYAMHNLWLNHAEFYIRIQMLDL